MRVIGSFNLVRLTENFLVATGEPVRSAGRASGSLIFVKILPLGAKQPAHSNRIGSSNAALFFSVIMINSVFPTLLPVNNCFAAHVKTEKNIQKLVVNIFKCF